MFPKTGQKKQSFEELKLISERLKIPGGPALKTT
jgi:hypothetical protein